MRYIPVLKFFSEEFVDVAPATPEEHIADALPGDLENERRSAFEASIEEEFRALRKWDVL